MEKEPARKLSDDELVEVMRLFNEEGYSLAGACRVLLRARNAALSALESS
jgi:hypothetical protein